VVNTPWPNLIPETEVRCQELLRLVEYTGKGNGGQSIAQWVEGARREARTH